MSLISPQTVLRPGVKHGDMPLFSNLWGNVLSLLWAMGFNIYFIKAKLVLNMVQKSSLREMHFKLAVSLGALQT